MIKEIKIENFKSIQSLNLELGRLNVFIGANGSGKSNILEGIAMGSAVAEGKGDSEFLASRGIRIVPEIQMKSGFDKSNNNIQIKFSSDLFKEFNIPIHYHIKKWERIENVKETSSTQFFSKQIREVFKSNNERLLKAYDIISNEASKKNTFSIENFKGVPSNELTEVFEIFDKLYNSLKINIDFLHFLIFSPENYFLRRFEEESQIKPLGIRGEGLFSHILEISKEKPIFFAKINQDIKLLDWFEGFEIPNDLMFTERRIKIKDQFLQEGVQYIDQRSANEGFLYLLFYLTLFISDETPKFFAIDNIDNAMNPKLGSELIRVLSKLAKEHDKQTILTTHNPSVLDGLDLSDDEQRLFVISRNKSGHTQAIRVPYKESDERLSTRFIRGAIGGLPKNF